MENIFEKNLVTCQVIIYRIPDDDLDRVIPVDTYLSTNHSDNHLYVYVDGKFSEKLVEVALATLKKKMPSQNQEISMSLYHVNSEGHYWDDWDNIHIKSPLVNLDSFVRLVRSSPEKLPDEIREQDISLGTANIVESWRSVSGAFNEVNIYKIVMQRRAQNDIQELLSFWVYYSESDKDSMDELIGHVASEIILPSCEGKPYRIELLQINKVAANLAF